MEVSDRLEKDPEWPRADSDGVGLLMACWDEFVRSSALRIIREAC